MSLLARVFRIDVSVCQRSQGPMRLRGGSRGSVFVTAWAERDERVGFTNSRLEHRTTPGTARHASKRRPQKRPLTGHTLWRQSKHTGESVAMCEQ